MSELISGKEALIALANGEEVEVFIDREWRLFQGSDAVGIFMNNCFEFRLKPRSIMIGNIEVPAPFDPKDGDVVFVLDNANPDGFSSFVFDSDFFTINFGA